MRGDHIDSGEGWLLREVVALFSLHLLALHFLPEGKSSYSGYRICVGALEIRFAWLGTD